MLNIVANQHVESCAICRHDKIKHSYKVVLYAQSSCGKKQTYVNNRLQKWTYVAADISRIKSWDKRAWYAALVHAARQHWFMLLDSIGPCCQIALVHAARQHWFMLLDSIGSCYQIALVHAARQPAISVRKKYLGYSFLHDI